jgi:ribosomal protein S18 acetylase RimI-like enzyme
MQYRLLNLHSGADPVFTNSRIADFLQEHLQEFSDETGDIMKALEYVFTKGRGGNIVLRLDGDEIVGAVVLNNTGMSGYIPENILVYIASHKDYRGQGIGTDLMMQAMKVSKGSIALHVEPDNPAVKLYEKLGFENKYLEMRLTR